MPCIQWKTSAAISAEQEKELREALGEAIAPDPRQERVVAHAGI